MLSRPWESSPNRSLIYLDISLALFEKWPGHETRIDCARSPDDKLILVT